MIGSSWWLLLFVMLAASVVWRQGPLFIFDLLLVLATAASELWARYCLAGVSYRRQLGATRLAFGEETEVTIEIVNAKPLPLAWLQLRDEWPEELALLTGRLGYSHKPLRRMLENWLALRWYERVRRTYRARGVRRGYFEFGPVEMVSGDVFGFRRRSAVVEQIETLLVYPKIVPVWNWRLPSGRPLGEALGQRRVFEDPLRSAGVRDYVPGDSPRHVHWKATARRRRLQTRLFDPGANRSLIIVVDTQTAEQGAYWIVPSYLELVISAAASIACHALDERQAVGLYANTYARGQAGLAHLPLGRDPAQRARVLEMLARLIGFAQLPCSVLLRDRLRALPMGASVATISARPNEDLQAALLAVQDAGHPAVLLTVGEKPIPEPPGLAVFHLGGEDAWKQLAALELA